jgi:hypoxanthine phosphoribosyltransferase
VGRTLFTERQIAARVRTLAGEIARDYCEDPIVIVGVLRGSFIFLADLVRALHRRGRRAMIDFMTLDSYGGGTASNGRVRLVQGFSTEVRGRRVLLVDDILDTGRTIEYARAYLRRRGAAEVRVCALLEKPARRVFPSVGADYIGFSVPDVFVVGYGLDYAGWHRDLPHIAEVRFADEGTR